MTESNGSAAAERNDDVPDWEERFRAPRVSLPDWAEDAPDRSLFVSNATGTYELYAWDRATGGQRQVTDRPNGTTDGVLSPDGAWIWWFDDKDGDEFGVWRRQPSRAARTRSPRPAWTPPTRRAWPWAGMAVRRSWAARPTTRAPPSSSCAPARSRWRSTGTASPRVSATSPTTAR